MLSQDARANGVKGAKAAAQRSIKAIKSSDYNLPAHWVTDWLLYVLEQPLLFLITEAQYQLTDEEFAAFTAGITKMQAGTPLAYLTGQQEFWSLVFKVNEHTLIPRPDTEVLVEQVLTWIGEYCASDFFPDQNSLSNQTSITTESDVNPSYQLLDLGTGSGCIAISLAHELAKMAPRQWQVTAIDYSAGALEVARQNAELNQVSNIDFIQSNWFKALPKGAKYHVIVSNPPYIDPHDTHLDRLAAEPLSALVAEDKGLADIHLIVSGATARLVPGGLLAIEHGFDQGQAVRQIFTKAGLTNIRTIKDYGGNDRLTLGSL